MKKGICQNNTGFLVSVINSYAQVFFSHNKTLALLLIIVSFFDVYAGLGGMIAVVVSNLTAYLMGFNRFNIKAGYYGFNSLLVGLGVGLFYQPSAEFFIFLFFVSILTLFITVSLEGVIGKYGLPYLSISFVLGIWMVTLAARQFSSLEISERGIYTLNEMYMMGGISMVKLYEWFNLLPLHESIKIYFRSLGAIFFQYHLFAGLLIAVGILIYSRIGFLLTLFGFYSAYFFYAIIGADISELSYSYIGFNYILSAIAIGGFFIVPSRYSFLWVMLLTPLISFTITSTSALLYTLQLSIFSLPFNLIVFLFLYILKFRERNYLTPELVAVQQFSPERNLYAQHNYKQRFQDVKYVPVDLPFWGEWKVTQGHSGKYTHKEDWQHAWDFEIFDDEGVKFKGGGRKPEDYYCYHKPVIAPDNGYVQEIVDGLEDNEIGNMDLQHNWGNSIVIKHNEKVFSQISHLKKDSFKVKQGDYVNKGDILAHVGNSGRSPEPHLHFQIQETPHVGSKTLDYPLASYIRINEDGFKLQSFTKPELNDTVSNIESNENLYDALHLIPGQKLKFSVKKENESQEKTFEWEVKSDIMNNTFIHCKTSKAKAYFRNKNNIFSFTNYHGKEKTLLYYFYLGGFKIATGYYKNLVIEDKYPVNIIRNKALKIVQDFIAPFFIFIKPVYKLRYIKSDDNIAESIIYLESSAEIKIGNKTLNKLAFKLIFKNKSLNTFIIKTENDTIEAIKHD